MWVMKSRPYAVVGYRERTLVAFGGGALRAFTWLFVLIALSGCPRSPTKVSGADLAGVSGSEEMQRSLQVVLMTPSTVQPGQRVPASIVGSGFDATATVQLGEREVSPVTMVDANTLRFTLPPLAEGVYDVTVRQADGEEATLRSGLQVLATLPASTRCEAVRVYFKLDSATLSSEARSALDAQAACFGRPGEILRVEGHADERGTTDYNVALGQRRAEAVTRYLIGQGVSSRHLTTVSYGEERPSNVGHNEAAWAQNRRVEVQPGR